jgi:hypothetical protein
MLITYIGSLEEEAGRERRIRTSQRGDHEESDATTSPIRLLSRQGTYFCYIRIRAISDLILFVQGETEQQRQDFAKEEEQRKKAAGDKLTGLLDNML